MTSFNKEEKKLSTKNENEDLSNSSFKRSNSISVFRSKIKTLDQSEDNSNIKDDKRKSQILFANSLEKTNDKQLSFSPQNIVGKSSQNKKNKKRLTFRKKFVDAIRVESYKKYNLDLSYNEPGYSDESSKCRCQII